MFKLEEVGPTSQEMLAVDSTIERFNPGYQDQWLSDPDPELNGNWSTGSPNCNYNWSARHFGGANVVFVDGHAEWMTNLKAAHDNKQLRIDDNQILGWQ